MLCAVNDIGDGGVASVINALRPSADLTTLTLRGTIRPHIHTYTHTHTQTDRQTDRHVRIQVLNSNMLYDWVPIVPLLNNGKE